MSMEVDQVSVSVGEKAIIREISLSIRSGQFVGMIGPNGSGKSTLLKTMYRVLQPDVGVIRLDDQELYRQTPRQVSRQLAVVSQETPVHFDFTVEEIVLMGRNPHKRMLEPDTAEDRAIVREALQRVGMLDAAQRSLLTLSGGEKQRVLIARALAQQAKWLILDEPTNHLDIQYQLQLMDLVRALEVTVVAALHDLNLAAAYCDYLFVMDSGQLAASGHPAQVLKPELLRDVFGVEAEVTVHPKTGKPHIVYLAAHAERFALTER
ncbi:heme ABC transporter ATP-binding protein [Brevibacillus humidisoli]|uniref:heme ABC transporter ATP-binding protein n=1 Tax=Brevibacillus humidisoli TaxID=2895522 RepID=UPI001E62CE65|nr:heme ABC transporter ATP-binding protein [Brevibacillus humidisoli]UFJ39818.1 heme ABC transporter ATP-binding protein [Brevibacillus humidisoli]